MPKKIKFSKTIYLTKNDDGRDYDNPNLYCLHTSEKHLGNEHSDGDIVAIYELKSVARLKITKPEVQVEFEPLKDKRK